MTGDVFGYSPDIGMFVTRGDKTYSEHGAVYESGGMFRSLPHAVDSHENYADWTEEQRAAKLTEVRRSYNERERQRDIEREARRALVAQAKKKLTEEEFQAILDDYGDYK
jgi:hypothetical protein